MILAIVVPCFNEQETLIHSVQELCDILSKLNADKFVSSESYILLVDDGSVDNTWTIIEQFCHDSKLVKGLKLARNFGHQAALLAGLDAVTGRCDAAISIDADLQQDPYAINRFIIEFQNGADVVNGVRRDRQSDSWIKKVTALGFYKVLRVMGVDIIPNHADYRLLSDRALKSLQMFKEPNIFLRAMCLNLSSNVKTVFFDVNARQFGETKYTVKKMIRLALHGVTSFSVVPLRLVSFIGFVLFLFSFFMGFYVICQALIFNDTVPGWASTVLPIYFIGGVQLFCLGIVGEYVGQIYKTVKKRPRCI